MRSSSHNHLRNKIILYIQSNLESKISHKKIERKLNKQNHNKRGNRDKKDPTILQVQSGSGIFVLTGSEFSKTRGPTDPKSSGLKTMTQSSGSVKNMEVRDKKTLKIKTVHIMFMN